MKTITHFLSKLSVILGIGAMALPALAASTVVVMPSNTQGWSTADTRPGGAVNFVADSTAPAGSGALQLTTDNTNTAKAQYMHSAANVPIADVAELSYSTKQNSASFSNGAPSYQLVVNLTGTGGFTTLVYEPYNNGGTITPNTWQSWDVDAGQFWSSKTVVCSNGTITAGAGGAPFYSLSDIKTTCPEAQVIGFGVNIGTYNPSYDVETDLVNFNGTSYDFEVATHTVTIDKYIDGQKATSTSANNSAFPMVATWNAANIGAGSGNYDLDADGFNGNPTPYQAITSPMTDGASYTTNEVTGGSVVGASCSEGKPYALVGYTTGDTATAAAGGTPSATVPNFTNLSKDQYVIVWNTKCGPTTVGPPTNMDQCKNDGWKTFNNPTFKNQGACVSYVQSNAKAGKRP